MLAYVQVSDACSEYCKIRFKTPFKCLKYFVIVIKDAEPTFFRQFKQVDLEKTYESECRKRLVAYICFIGQYAL